MTALIFMPLIAFERPEKITEKSGLSSVCISLLEKGQQLYFKHFPMCETKKTLSQSLLQQRKCKALFHPWLAVEVCAAEWADLAAIIRMA